MCHVCLVAMMVIVSRKLGGPRCLVRRLRVNLCSWVKSELNVVCAGWSHNFGLIRLERTEGVTCNFSVTNWLFLWVVTNS